MSKEKYVKDLEEIKDIMKRSSRFISLSGMSGISAGIFALAGAYAAYRMVLGNQALEYDKAVLTNNDLTTLLIIAGLCLILAVSSGIFFTSRETKKRKQKVWDHQTKRLLINLAIPLVTGGLLCLIMLFNNYLGIIIPMTLIFYGLALVNISKYTLNELRSLGILEIALGLGAACFIEFSLIFWALGFGALHIIYGIVMQIKNKS
jgi:hypothetical protein